MAGVQTKTTSPEVVRIFAALSDENRFRIIELLAIERQALTCGAICSELELSPSLISHHLSILERADLIDRRKDGVWTLNRLRRERLSQHIRRLEQLVG